MNLNGGKTSGSKIDLQEKPVKRRSAEAKKAWLEQRRIGCVTYEDKIIGRLQPSDGRSAARCTCGDRGNQKSVQRMGDWRLEECELYVTLVRA